MWAAPSATARTSGCRPGEAEGVSAKSMMRVLSKCLSQGVTVEISAHGEDEEQAVEALAALVESGFGEEE